MDLLTELAVSWDRRFRRRPLVAFSQVVRRPHKVLAVPAQGPGELLLALPAIRLLRRHYADSLLGLLIGDQKRGLWRFDDEADEVIDFRPDLLSGPGSAEFRRLRRILRAGQYDIIIDLNHRPDRLLSYLLHRAQPQVHCGLSSPAADQMRNLVIRQHGLPGDEIQRNIQMLRVLGADTAWRPEYWPLMEELEGKKDFRKRLKGPGPGQAVLVLDGWKSSSKNLGQFLAWADSKPELRVQLFNMDQTAWRAPSDRIGFFNTPSEIELAEILYQSSCYIGTKSDIFSLAYLLRLPCLVVAGQQERGLPEPGLQLTIMRSKKPGEFPLESATRMAAEAMSTSQQKYIDKEGK